ncbi:hypothetical protein GCM10023229_34450 [Flavisolibacter ginsenosidimutans]
MSLAACFFYVEMMAQGCPPNIDFEAGNFNNWTCYTGFTASVGGVNQINLTVSGPTFNRHTMYTASTGETDPYGGFSVHCPNGSRHSIRLGNDQGGGEAEGISYEFAIPANRNEYSLIYQYAVVFEDPVHEVSQQPRMVVEITNVTDNEIISCSSLTFIPFGNILPGFFESSTKGPDGTPIWCKDWSAVSINLDHLAGKTIKLFFKTADCTFRRHFGYAYIDVNSECSSEFVGATFCADDTAVTVTAPYGYQNYTWYNNNFTQVLGNEQRLRFYPPPPVGTTVAVEVIPYNGYGCIDTLYARLVDTLKLRAHAGSDALYCGNEPVMIGENPKPEVVYSWSPAIGLSDPNIADPLASPQTTTTYLLTVRSSGGGCRNQDSVVVRSSSLDSTLTVLGKTVYCLGNDDSTVLNVQAADKIQWYKNGVPVTGANKPRYEVTQTGSYSAVLSSNLGCTVNTRSQSVLIDQAKPGITYPVEYAAINLPYSLQARTFGTSVLWQPSTYLDNPSSVTPMFKGATEQSYTIRIETVTGCVTVDTQLVKVVPQADIFVPTAFTPNGDGMNDILRPVLMGIKQLTYFRIYNRWGQLLHETRIASAEWDGKVGGVPQPSGVVVWIAEGIGSDGRIYTRKGTSVLIR